MTKRSVIMLVILSVITFGIYLLYWLVKTKDEMVRQGADIPTAWLLIVPIASIYFMWKFCGGVEHVSGGKLSQVLAFVLILALGVIGLAVIQAELNKAADRGMPGQLPQARVA